MAKQPDYIVTEAMIIGRNWDRKAGPFYSVHVVSQVFFAMSSSWLRLKLSPERDRPYGSFLNPDGTPMVFRRRDPAKSDSARVFTLADVEKMARSLVRLGDISSAKYAKILTLVNAQADLFGLFDPIEEPKSA